MTSMKPPARWIFAPSRDCPPDGRIALGNVVVSPALPDEPLNTPRVPAAHVDTHNARDWTLDSSQARGGRVGVWASFLQVLVGAGGDAGVGWARGVAQRWDVRNMRTHTFAPTQAFVEAEVRGDAVRDYLAGNRFRRKVYMITGIKVATGARGFTEFMQERSFDARLGVDGTMFNAPLATGPQFEARGRSSTAVSFEDADDFVFAFSLKEIRVKRKGEVRQRHFKDGHFFSLGRQSGDERVGDREDFEVVGLAEDDAGGDEFDLEEIGAVEEETGEDCICVKPED